MTGSKSVMPNGKRKWSRRVSKDKKPKSPLDIPLNQFWLGAPCRYDPKRPDLKGLGLPDGDLGGRCISIPADVPPSKFFDQVMPNVFGIQQEARRRQMTGQTQGLHPDGALAEGIQCLWVFTSDAVNALETRLTFAYREIDELKARMEKLEKQLTEN